MTLSAGFMFIFPKLTIWLRRLGLAPKTVDGRLHSNMVSDDLGRRALASLQESRIGREEEKKNPGDQQGGCYEFLMQRLYTHYRQSGSKPTAAVPSLEYILSDALDHSGRA